MSSASVCAVVVTFHPDEDVFANLVIVRPQVENLVVIDNGSTEDELRPLRAFAATYTFEVIENGENLGIASALNIGVQRALALDSTWVLLFDQDSRVTDGFAATMLRCFETSAWRERLAVLVPRYIDKRLGTPLLPGVPVREGIEAATTSGSLARVQTLIDFPFRDELFIDAVDYEHSLRLRRDGRVLDECREAVLLHSPGEPHLHGVFGRVLFRTANYSPARRYYQERNKIWVARRYFFAFPLFCLKLFSFSVKDFIKLVLAEPDKGMKIRFFLRGILDGLRNRMGPLKAR